MPSYHKVYIVGHVGNEPKLRYSGKGTPMASFSVATNYRAGDDDITTWWRVTTFGKLGEFCAENVRKGDLVFIEGRMSPGDNGSPRIWQDGEGNSHASYEVIASVVIIPRSSGGKNGDWYNEPYEEESDDETIEGKELPF